MSPHKKLWWLLFPNERRAAVALLGLMLTGALLETMGIGLIIPMLVLMTPGVLNSKYPMLSSLLRYFGDFSRQQLIIDGLLALVLFHAIRLLFLGFLSWRQSGFTFGIQAAISQRLFAGYLRQPYRFHLQRNSAQVIHRAMGQVNDVTNFILQSLVIMTETLVMVGISVLLLTVEPLGTLLVVSLLCLAGWAFNHLTRVHNARWGRARQMHERQRIQHLQQGLGGIKEVILFGREDDFLAQYRLHNFSSARMGQRNNFLQALPRLWLEMLILSGLASLVVTMIWQGKPWETVLPTLGLFAAAAFRLLPSVNRIMNAGQSVQFVYPVIEVIAGELLALDGAQSSSKEKRALSVKNTLSLDQVSFRYPSTETLALREISLVISRGEMVGFIGRSGAGKSTLVDIILGLLTPTGGAVKVDGVDIQTNLRGWQDQIGYVPQAIFLTDDTIRRNVAFGLSNDKIDEASVRRAIRAAQLEPFINDLPNGLDTVVGERGVRLSGGQRQRIGIARALYHDPPMLVLDEATSSLDNSTETDVMDAVRALHGDKTILIVSHRLSTLEHCDRLCHLEKGVAVEERRTPETSGQDAGRTS